MLHQELLLDNRIVKESIRKKAGRYSTVTLIIASLLPTYRLIGTPAQMVA